MIATFHTKYKMNVLKVFFPFFRNHVSIHEIFYHLKLRCSVTQKRGGERLLPFFPFCILESELRSSNNLFFTLFFTLFFRVNNTVKTPSNSAKKLYDCLAGLSVNILRTGDKSPMQRGFFTNTTGN